MFPTPVGMNRDKLRFLHFIYCVPHARGDEPFLTFLTVPGVMCSPRPWG